jgi:hypothetical protein
MGKYPSLKRRDIMSRKVLRRKHTAPTGYTAWASDDEIACLTKDTTKSNMNICMNQALLAFDAINNIYSRLPEGSETHYAIGEIGQELYNLIGNITTAYDSIILPSKTKEVK